MAKYTTQFPNTEDPLAESGEWAVSANTNLTTMRSAAGKCIANAVGAGSYDDSAAILVDAIADTKEMTCGVFVDGTLNPAATHECELLSRSTATTTITTQYENLYAFSGGCQFVRWYNNGGSQGFDFVTAAFGPESLGRGFTTGDKIKTRAVKSFHILSVIDGSNVETILAVYIDSNILTGGQPGIGGFTRVSDGGDASKFCFTSAQISDEFALTELAADTFTRANESPLSNGGKWSTATGMNALNLVSNGVETATDDSDSGMRYTDVSFYIDHFSEIIIDLVGGRDFGPAVCMQSDGDCYLVTNFDAAVIYVFSRKSGSFNQLGTVAGTYAASDVIALRRFGPDLILSVNGSDVLTCQDAADATDVIGGSAGIFMYDGASRIASWRGGNITADYIPLSGGGGTVYSSVASDSIALTDQLLSSAFRNRSASDSSVIADALISNYVRGRVGQDVLTTVDNLNSRMMRGVIATDTLLINDGLLTSLIRNRLLGDSVQVTDELIAAAGRIVTAILTSTLTSSDNTFSQMLRGVVTDDLINAVDQALLQFNLSRILESPIQLEDSQFNFKLLTRRLEDSASMNDFISAIFVPGNTGQVDGSKIVTGFQRQPIAIGTSNKIVIN